MLLSEKIEDEVKKRHGLFIKRGYWHAANGVPWHRIVCEKAHGKIPRGWHVHHIDGNKLNNKLLNLIAVPEKLHSQIHNLARLPTRQAIEYWLRNGGCIPKKVLKRNHRKRKIKTKLPKPKKIKVPKSPSKPKMTETQKIAQSNFIEEFIKTNPDCYKIYKSEASRNWFWT